ncbi:S1 family peptidase [Actinoallomurus rhizosphaericola]|uniref:S1 family peptidase n=1 Tax=Actinoallomurus rhizosphaericola TaxID=2952536 RepID=UPI002092C5C2|nr:S1 family peptidase [Actinoallomurus rhizosphaericola]MCO5997080.1 S1 family peptidase [Actinoallomurus rhizosphaericola]
MRLQRTASRRVRRCGVTTGLAAGLLLGAPAAHAASRVPHEPVPAAPLATEVTGGDPVYGGGHRCTVGVNVAGGGSSYFITAGHCGNAASTWTTASGESVGTTAGSSFPGDDYAIVRYGGGVSHPGTVGAQDIVSAGIAHVGEAVCMRGGVSGVRCGRVVAINATVAYAEGAVYGLIRTSICAAAGDTGAPLYDGGTVLGVLSGFSGDCAAGGVSYFEPIAKPLSAYGVSVY